MKRNAENWLSNWYSKNNRKPLIIRGARQVGKSFLVRQFAKNLGLNLIEINLEKYSRLDSVFSTFDITRIMNECEFVSGKSFVPDLKNNLLFLDEIQAAPNAIASLRYFFEEKNDLPVIAAGSLFEFALTDHTFSMPVGRVEFYYLGPLTFKEYLDAKGKKQLSTYISSFSFDTTPSDAAHEQLLLHLREFMIAGGMPEATNLFVQTGSMSGVHEIHESIIETYKADFSKYASKEELAIIRRVFSYVPSTVGEKFKYVNVDPHLRAHQVRSAFNLLSLAGLVTPVYHTSASGIPLGAMSDSSVYKPLFLDIGLMNAMCGIKAISDESFVSAKFINKGHIAEQFIGQHLLYNLAEGFRPEIFYWLREGKKNNAEIDYLLQIDTNILPVEVKAGKAGSLKSLHQFILEKQSGIAIRFDCSQPDYHNVNVSSGTQSGTTAISFKLLSLPLYMVEDMRRIVSGYLS